MAKRGFLVNIMGGIDIIAGIMLLFAGMGDIAMYVALALFVKGGISLISLEF